MTTLRSCLVVCALCAVVAFGCKKKDAEPAQGSGSAAMAGSGSGSGSAAMAGSDSGSGSAAMAGSGSGSAAMAGSGSAAMAGSGSGSAAGSGAGSGSAATAAAMPPSDPEGARKWNCKKTCKRAVDCKAGVKFTNLKECESDCTNLAKDKGGRYARGSAQSAAYYTCIDKTTACPGIKKCDHDVAHVK
jgi:hypothetical protein